MSEPPPRNVLVVVLDDAGLDKVGVYGVSPDAPPTPTIDALAARGVLFRRAYANPWCSPSRACLLTGRYGFRTGIGNPVNQQAPDFALQDEEITLPEALDLAAPGRVDNAAIGKWHLTSLVGGDSTHPNRQGFHWFEGTPGNFARDTFERHRKLTNGLLTVSTQYATSEQVDDALARVECMREPWLVYLAFNAIHEPFHAPPRHLHTYELQGKPEETPYEHSCAAMQALDTELGRLLDGMRADVLERTTIVVVGDNGSLERTVARGFKGSAKGTVAERGVRVPLIVAGAGVESPGRESDALVHVVDLFATIGDFFGLDLVSTAASDGRPIDAVSFASVLADPDAPPVRDHVYLETFGPNGRGPYTARRRGLRDERWKLIEGQRAPDRFFDLSRFELDDRDLMRNGALDAEQRAAYERLKARLRELAGP